MMFIFAVMIFVLPFSGILVLFAGSIILFCFSRLSWKLLFAGLKPFVVLFLFIAVASVLWGGGEKSSAGILIIRLIAAVIISQVLTGTTTFGDIRKTVAWFCMPLPRKIGFTLSTMLSVSISFVPLIFQKAGEIREAQAARGINPAKRPFQMIKVFSFSLLIESLDTAVSAADSMVSRCYNENRTLTFPAKSREKSRSTGILALLSTLLAVCAAGLGFFFPVF